MIQHRITLIPHTRQRREGRSVKRIVGRQCSPNSGPKSQCQGDLRNVERLSPSVGNPGGRIFLLIPSCQRMTIPGADKPLARLCSGRRRVVAVGVGETELFRVQSDASRIGIACSVVDDPGASGVVLTGEDRSESAPKAVRTVSRIGLVI